MTLSIYVICVALVQVSSAQVLSYVQRSSIPQQAVEAPLRYVSNTANALNNAISTANNGITVARVPTPLPVAGSTVAANPNVVTPASNANIASANTANINVANAIASQNIANANYAAGYVNAANQNAANALASNAANYANSYAHQNIAYTANAATPASVPNTPVSVANIIANTNSNNAELLKAAIENINGNVATFNLGTNGNTFTVTSGSPGAQGFGISVIADALEVGGTVAVNGQIPIFGTVAVNGNVPTDGAANVSYNCGGKQIPLVV